MKKQILSIIIGTIVLVFLFSTLQAQTVTLTFTGKDANNQYVQLNRVAITNLTKGWQETIYWPDTTLTMQNGTGIDESVANGGFGLSQNNPNPFTGTTDVNLTVADAGAVTLEIVDGNGKIVETRHGTSLQPGTHEFRVSLSATGTYVMTARQNGKTSPIKMVCNGAGNGNGIEYAGIVKTTHALSPQPKSTTTNPFNFGDQMEYVGCAIINGTEYESARISQAQGASQTFAMMFDAIQTQEQVPSVSTAAVTGITPTSAIVGGTVTSDGGSTVIDRGICWNTTGTPTLNDNCLHIGSGMGAFSDNLTGLTEGTTYYIRAYAINNAGVGYGNAVTFSTSTPSDQPFTIITAEVFDISSWSATCGGEVISNGGFFVASRGVCWDTLHFPLVYGNHIANGSGTGSFTCNITDLQYGTTYYVRAYATDSVGTAYYGNEVSFTTAPVLPRVIPTAISNITTTTATGGGNVTDDGGAPVTARGVCWSSTSQNPTIADSHTIDGGGTGSFTSNITGLAPNYTLYYVRAYATNSVGTSYGYRQQFITNPTSQDGPPCPGTATLTDIDGNIYNTVQIGTQCWMKENLRAKKYANGTAIPQGSDTSTITAYWYYPNNNPSNQSAYGLLYNWKAMMRNSTSSGANPSGVQGICPTGWHVPSDAEWTQLTDFVSSQSEYVCGGDDTYIAKALSGTTGWASATASCGPCSVCTMPSSTNNATGFSALPAGYYAYNGIYSKFNCAAIFWSTTREDYRCFYRNISYLYPDVILYDPNYIWEENACGFSVRCVKD